VIELDEVEAEHKNVCPDCSSPIEHDYLVCPVCARQLASRCPACDRKVQSHWLVCAYCCTKLGHEPHGSAKPPQAPGARDKGERKAEDAALVGAR
jgi:predicted amidophosphoribosyltransferase